MNILLVLLRSEIYAQSSSFKSTTWSPPCRGHTSCRERPCNFTFRHSSRAHPPDLTNPERPQTCLNLFAPAYICRPTASLAKYHKIVHCLFGTLCDYVADPVSRSLVQKLAGASLANPIASPSDYTYSILKDRKFYAITNTENYNFPAYQGLVF